MHLCLRTHIPFCCPQSLRGMGLCTLLAHPCQPLRRFRQDRVYVFSPYPILSTPPQLPPLPSSSPRVPSQPIMSPSLPPSITLGFSSPPSLTGLSASVPWRI